MPSPNSSADAVLVLRDFPQATPWLVSSSRTNGDPTTTRVQLAALRGRLAEPPPTCRGHLLVPGPDERTARWAATPVETGHGSFILIVLGPSGCPPITNTASARRSRSGDALGNDASWQLGCSPALPAVFDPDIVNHRIYAAIIRNVFPAHVLSATGGHLDNLIPHGSRGNRLGPRTHRQTQSQAQTEGLGRVCEQVWNRTRTGLGRDSKRGLERGLEQGLEQDARAGLERGLERGPEQGLEQGLERQVANQAKTLRRCSRRRTSPSTTHPATGSMRAPIPISSAHGRCGP